MDNKYLGLMGMSEMEWAVQRMEEIAQTKGVPISQVRVTPPDFFPDGDHYKGSVLIGFCHLLASGWMVSDYPNGTFIMSIELVDRLKTRWQQNYPPPRRYIDSLSEILQQSKPGTIVETK